MGISPFSTLRDVKALFPHANFNLRKPAWAQETDVMYEVTGQGISGTIIIKFDDVRPWTRGAIQLPMSSANNAINEQIYAQPQQAQRLPELSDDEVLIVSWVRWVPSTGIPLTRLMAKYGKPDQAGFSDDDLRPFRGWSKRGIHAALSDNQKNVLLIDYTYTKNEKENAWRKMFGTDPPGYTAPKKKKKRQ